MNETSRIISLNIRLKKIRKESRYRRGVPRHRMIWSFLEAVENFCYLGDTPGAISSVVDRKNKEE